MYITINVYKCTIKDKFITFKVRIAFQFYIYVSNVSNKSNFPTFTLKNVDFDLKYVDFKYVDFK